MNVHAGRTFREVLANLENYSARVQGLIGEPIGIGLWFSESSAREALDLGNLERLRETLDRYSLVPYTINGFPQGDFHQKVVKHAVYLPTWWDTSRLEYTRKLVRILDAMLPEGQMGSISTLPIAWGGQEPSNEQIRVASKNLIFLAQELARLKESTGRHIVIAIEPEPGCYLTSTSTFVRFYCDHLLSECTSSVAKDHVLNHITLCHDICHAAVMFEDQAAELGSLFRQGIRVGKVQVSSAISVPWYRMSPEQREAAYMQLTQFAEDRYLHQTSIGELDGNESTGHSVVIRSMVEDLPIALHPEPSDEASRDLVVEGGVGADEWRVHFHVPLYVELFGELRTTQDEIFKTASLLVPRAGKDAFPTGHFEVETYAWTVLPEGLKVPDLATGIAKEMEWFKAKALDPHR